MSCCDSLSEEINGLKIEISRLVNREFDLECEVKRLREENKKKGDVLTTLDEMIRNQSVSDLIAEVKRLREGSKKKGDVLTTLDEMIRNYASHVEMMKALEQGLGLPETWKEMIE